MHAAALLRCDGNYVKVLMDIVQILVLICNQSVSQN